MIARLDHIWISNGHQQSFFLRIMSDVCPFDYLTAADVITQVEDSVRVWAISHTWHTGAKASHCPNQSPTSHKYSNLKLFGTH